MPTQTFSLNDQYKQFIKDMVESGRYDNASEVIRAGLNLLQEEEEFMKRKFEALSWHLEAQLRCSSGAAMGHVFEALEERVKKLKAVQMKRMK